MNKIFRNSVTINPEDIREIKVYSFFLFIFWPILLIVSFFTIIYNLVKLFFPKKNKHTILQNITSSLSLVLLPIHLLQVSCKERNIKLFCGLLLLLPFILAVIGNIFIIPVPVSTPGAVLQPPHILNIFGTDAHGKNIGYILSTGARNIYVMSLVTLFFILFSGIYLGKKTIHQKADSLIMGFVQVVETVPVLFILLIILALFSWWEDIAKINTIVSMLLFFLRIIVVGLLIGFSFLPRMIRLIREKINTFISENFIDGTKAHGINLKRIIDFHIIKKNCLGDIITITAQILAAAILLEISLDYLISISPVVGARIYESWAGMLLTDEVRNAIINYLPEFNFTCWWIYIYPVFFIITTVSGFHLFGEGLGSIYYEDTGKGEYHHLLFYNRIASFLAKFNLWK
ncbi:MAG: ABC transporter permease subunit [Spirochaetales bacterium]|nr:ABC transporter permease subunit [Spirochaetales bacterium]